MVAMLSCHAGGKSLRLPVFVEDASGDVLIVSGDGLGAVNDGTVVLVEVGSVSLWGVAQGSELRGLVVSLLEGGSQDRPAEERAGSPALVADEVASQRDGEV
jgi:hypothetical protein